MNITLEPLTRYDRAFRYALHDAYFQARGIAAWTENEIPHEITTNLGTARQHVRVVLAHFLGVEAKLGDGPYVVMEIGGGLGRFACNFFRALDALTEEGAARLATRIRYVFSDVSPLSVGEASASPDLAPYVESGRLIPAIFDVRTPDSLLGLDGTHLDLPLHAVLVNYVVCTTPMRIVQKRADTWLELYCDVAAPVDDEAEAPDAETLRNQYLEDPIRPGAMAELVANVVLMPTVLDDAFDAPHPAVLRDLFATFDIATASYPESFVRCLVALAERTGPGGLFAIGDLGRAIANELSGEKVPLPLHYGNTLNHSVNYGLYDAIGTALGFGVVRTHGYLPSIVQAVLVAGGPVPEAVATAFQRHVVEVHEGHELLDACEAAVDAAKAEAYHRAVRFFKKAVDIDPLNPRLLYLFGETCVYAGYYELARDVLERGFHLDGNVRYDFDFLLGRVYASLDEPKRAIEWLSSALRKEEHAVTLTNLAEVHLQLGDENEAYLCYQRALRRDPGHEQAKDRLEALKETWWKRHTAPLDQKLG